MRFQDIKLLVFIPILAIILLILHLFLFETLATDCTVFYYKISTLYLTFTLMSIIIIGILLFIKTKNLDIVGMSFLVLTSLKMVICYIMVRPILNLSQNEMYVQKMNFFGIFITFLIIETVITIRILNNK